MLVAGRPRGRGDEVDGDSNIDNAWRDVINGWDDASIGRGDIADDMRTLICAFSIQQYWLLYISEFIEKVHCMTTYVSFTPTTPVPLTNSRPCAELIVMVLLLR